MLNRLNYSDDVVAHLPSGIGDHLLESPVAISEGIFAALGIAGFGYLAGQTRAMTILQLGVEDHQRGRIMALWSVCSLCTRPLASLLDGTLATLIGIHAAALIMTTPVFAAAVGMLLLYRQQLRAAARAEAEGSILDGSPASHD